MRRFAALIDQLDHTGGTAAKVALLQRWLAAEPAADAAWALHCLLGKQRRRLITARRLRQICLEQAGLPEWLFDDCYAQVGDTAETIALLWRQVALQGAAPAQHSPAEAPLHGWMEEVLPGVAGLEGEAQAEAVRALWSRLDGMELLVMNKLLSGGFRIGVAQGLVLRALAGLSGQEESLLAHRLMGGFTPTPAAWAALLAAEQGDEARSSRPYPFFLASPLELPADPGTAPLAGGVHDWLIEWKWDGIRGQLIRRGGASLLWSRGQELINPAFPELIALADTLPEGTVLDGEVIVWPAGEPRPAPFAALQRRLGRRAPGPKLLAECPAVFLAYDLLEQGGQDLRPQPLRQRRAALEALQRQRPAAADAPEAGPLRLSPPLALAGWEELEALRQQARAVGAEGLMLKAAASPYLAGRRRGHWWKHKLEPYRLDAVLLYAQAGSGRRANLFTDYTFGLWDRAGGERRLVSFAKAYSGLNDREITALDRWIRSHTTERFGPVRAVEPEQVFELAFEGLQASRRHKSGIAVRFPRISRWRQDKPAGEADTLAAALALLEPRPLSGTPSGHPPAAG
ncbi:ATP-dependent DNA ligase [Cyanobium sp. NIES-981]|uniref:ATP-dependent DNA ligase n=1 Tax=Cyanobium sp. NIES-981 TaxID=1851505 RepID=UPI0007DD33D7|nr:ATP-dependent DNA ligase [Cyanobium sp. NIES-981]SBO42056.1 Thermostable DNA ligase [Cyanobium sp. NIES-981]